MESDYVKHIIIKEDFISEYRHKILENSRHIIKPSPITSVDLFHDCTLVSQRISDYHVYVASIDEYEIKNFLGNLERIGIDFEVKK